MKGIFPAVSLLDMGGDSSDESVRSLSELIKCRYGTASRARRAAPMGAASGPRVAATICVDSKLGWKERRPASQIVAATRSEEHTSELQSRVDLVCRLLL